MASGIEPIVRLIVGEEIAIYTNNHPDSLEYLLFVRHVAYCV